eukprot:SAG11_NODE_113_length_16061_cov_16.161143_4_plen_176_part_00
MDEISSELCLDEARDRAGDDWNEDIYKVAWNETFGKFTFEDEAADPTAKRLAFGGAASTSEIDSNLLMEAEVLKIQNGGAIQAHWMPDDDEDATVGNPTSTEEMALLDSIPQPENLKKDYKKELERLREAAEQPNADYAALDGQLLNLLVGTQFSAWRLFGVPVPVYCCNLYLQS